MIRLNAISISQIICPNNGINAYSVVRGDKRQQISWLDSVFDYQVTNKLKTLTALIEPVMLVFVGITVGGMMMAIIAPIYGLISQVGSL